MIPPASSFERPAESSSDALAAGLLRLALASNGDWERRVLLGRRLLRASTPAKRPMTPAFAFLLQMFSTMLATRGW
jgi:hypothetical protein